MGGINEVVKLGRLPVIIGGAGQCMPIHHDAFGWEWNVQLSLTPAIPELIGGQSSVSDPARRGVPCAEVGMHCILAI